MMDDAVSFFDAALRSLREGLGAGRFKWSRPGPVAFPDPTWQMAADCGWFRVLLSEERGGLGLGLPELGAIFRAVGLGLMRGPLLDQAVALPVVLDHPALPASVRERLAAALDGKALVCLVESLDSPYGRTEDMLRVVDGQLRGNAALVPFGQHATDLLVHTADTDGPCILCLPADCAQRQARDSLDPCVDYARVEFDAVRVAAPDIVARGESANALVRRIHDIQRLMIACELAGVAEALTTMAVDYARTRKQFGQAIGAFQALQHMLATMAVRSGALRHLVTFTLADAQAEPARLSELAAMAKAFADKAGRFLGVECLQIHGAMGFTEEVPLHLYYRRVLSNQSYRGEADALLLALGQSTVAQREDAAVPS